MTESTKNKIYNFMFGAISLSLALVPLASLIYDVILYNI